MKPTLTIALILFFGAGCASPSHVSDTNSSALPGKGGPNWEAVDKTVERVRAHERSKLQAVETEYATALESARTEIRKANPKMSDSDIESEAIKRADEVKRRQEMSFTRRASSTYELKRP